MYAQDLVVDHSRHVEIVEDLRTRAVVSGGLVVNHSRRVDTVDARVGLVSTDLCAVLPRVRVAVLALTLLVEAVNLSDLPALVVPTEKGDVGRVPGIAG